MVIYSWKSQMSETDKDIAEYLERRYEDYCRDTKQYSVEGKDWYKNREREKHYDKQDSLVEFGFKLRKKLNFFLDGSRKELFEQALEETETLDKYIKGKYDDFCKDLEETNKALPTNKQKGMSTLHEEMSDKEKHLFNYKERMKDWLFIENIDKRRADYEKRRTEYEKEKPEREAKKKAEEERTARNIKKKGFTNVKPLSFYEEMYIKGDSPFSYGDITESKYYMEIELKYDTYFEENGTPKGTWKTYRTGSFNERKYWDGDNAISDRRPEEYTSADTPNENQKYLERCKGIANMLINLKDSKSNQLQLRHIEILQKYLTKGYLITRQIAWFVRHIKNTLIEELSIDPNNPGRIIQKHPSKEYNVNIYNDDFDIEKIKEDVNEFVRVNEDKILTPIEYLKVYLRKHDNRITVVRYALIINKSYKVSLRILKGFVSDKKLKVKTEAKGKLIFFD